MVNTNKLRGIIAERGYTQAQIAKKIGITPKTFYEKMDRKVFLSNEIESMVEILNIHDI